MHCKPSVPCKLLLVRYAVDSIPAECPHGSTLRSSFCCWLFTWPHNDTERNLCQSTCPYSRHVGHVNRNRQGQGIGKQASPRGGYDCHARDPAGLASPADRAEI